MNARQMFESLGYEYCKYYDRNRIIQYYNEKEDIQFLFWIAEQEFSVSEYGELKNITVDEFKAIQQQLKELHWIDEKTEIKEARNPEVTNLEYYKDEILEDCVWNLAVVNGRPKPCNRINCYDCEFYDDNATECYKRAAEWLKQPCTKSTCELTQFEYDLLQSYSNIYKLKFKTMPFLDRMKEKGYFKGINEDETIEDILAKCEVVG